MKVEVEKLIHISINKKEHDILCKANGLLQEIYESLDNDLEIGDKAYDASELIDAILNEVLINDKEK